MVPRTVLTRSGPISLNAARPVNTVQPRTTVNNAGPMKNVINNVYSTARRPFNKLTATNNSNFNKRVNTVNDKNVNAVRPNAVVNTARPKAVISVVKGNKGNAVKASTCWVWRPKHKVLDHVSRKNGASMSFKRFDYVDAQGGSKYMTGNRSHWEDYEEINGGFVAFRGNSKGGKITGKGKIRTDFKLIDDSHVLLKVPRKDNMYSVDLKNVVPQGGRKLALNFMRPFGCHVTILNTIDHLNKFDRKADEGFFVGYSTNSKAFRDSPDAGFKPSREGEKKDAEDPGNKSRNPTEGKDSEVSSNIVSSTINDAGSEVNAVDLKTSIELPDDLNMPELKDIVYSDDDEDVGAEADINNLDTNIPVSPILTIRIHKDLPVEQIIGDIYSVPQTRRMTKSVTEQAMFSSVQQRTNHKDFQNCLFACFLSQEEPKKVFDPVARIEAIRLFLAYASFKDFVVYQMDVKSAFLYGKIEKEVYVCQPPGFEDPDFPNRVYKVEKALYGLH
ncbi:retrovirus-related pol polyprotein from transposon TNT 1-94 [Tanacetum coccineum]|uniref:Retrovirus-related pol polyprotein from transposon TNT 1-94 n=1 Tax=Tanacetum coccineum TaxID=301880 RepID=A0ABQ4ZJH6_9ASTR